MSIELPSEVEWFLNLIGINWPNISEDAVREFGSHVRDFANNVDNTHQAATATIQTMGESYTGASYEQLVTTWAQKSQAHMQDLVSACHVVADALNVAADAIIAAKIAAIAELVAMAASFVADQAAAVLTFGAAEAAEALIVEAAKKLINDLIQQLEQTIISDVIGAAVEPLEASIEKAVDGLVFQGLQSLLSGGGGAGGGGGGGGSVGPSFSMIPDGIRASAQELHGHADAIVGHAQDFASKAAAVKFGE
jgi:uncharacterized protein YukE